MAQEIRHARRKLMKTLLIILGCCGLFSGFAADTNVSTASASSANTVAGITSMDSLDDKQLLAIGDLVSFRILEDRDEIKSLSVKDAGELEIPYLGRVQAAEKTCKKLALEIKEGLEKDLYKHATVLIAIDSLNKNRGKVYIAGAVRGTGMQEIPSDGELTVSKAILRAGGFTEYADKRNVRLMRKGKSSDNGKTIIVDVTAVIEKGKFDKDYKLEPEDFIFVPAKIINF